MKKNLMHIYCGEAKGKTTASMGLALRMAGNDGKVVIVQFLKDGTAKELEALKKLDNITVICENPVNKFTFQMTDEEKEFAKNANTATLKKALELDCDMLVLDEVCSTYELGLIDTNIVDELINNELKFELVMTGRNPSENMIEKADYVTEMSKIKHPFDNGVPARKGIEF